MRIVVIATLALGLLACSKPAEPETDAAAASSASPSLTVSLVAAREVSIERTVSASGPIGAWEEMLLGVELSGQRVTALNVEVGERVRRGQVLLTLDDRTLQSEAKVAQAALTEAAAGVQLADLNLARGVKISKKRLISEADLDQLRAAKVQAQARLETTRAQAQGAQLRVSFTELRAPDDGVISERRVRSGEVVSAGAELLRLIRQGRLEWRAELDDASLRGVQVGARVALDEGIEGQVRAVTPGVDARTRTGTAYVDLPPTSNLKVGSFVEGRISLQQARVIVVPAQALIRRDGYAYVYTVDGKNVAKRVRVAVGGSTAEGVEITEGLQALTPVVARGAGFLSDGDLVRVVTLAEPAAAGVAK